MKVNSLTSPGILLNPIKKACVRLLKFWKRPIISISPIWLSLSSQRRRKDLSAYQRTAEKLNQGAEQADEAGIRAGIS